MNVRIVWVRGKCWWVKSSLATADERSNCEFLEIILSKFDISLVAKEIVLGIVPGMVLYFHIQIIVKIW